MLFRNSGGQDSYLITTQNMAEDMPKWQSWIGNIAMQGKLVSTAPIEYYASIINNNGVTHGHPHKEENDVLVSGFLICKTDSAEEVEEWSKTCPILKYLNSSVEVRTIIPFPIN